MTRFEENITVLKQTNTELCERIQCLNGDDSCPMDVVLSRSSLPTLKLQKNGHEILLHSLYDPLSEASRFVSSFNITQETKLVFVFGVGFAYHVREILSKLPQHAHLILIERDEHIFKKALENVDFSFLNDNRVSLFCGDFNVDEITLKVCPLFYPKIPDEKDVLLVPHRASVQIHPQYYRWLHGKIKDFASQFAVAVTTHVFVSTGWSVNILKNIDELIKAPPVESLFGKNKGKPAIVVSAGPSLDKNIDVLKEVQDRALIIAVGTSLKPLLQRGIKPHLVVAIDADKKHYEHFKDVKAHEDTILIYDGMIFPRILDDFKGMKLSSDTSESPIKTWLYSYIGAKGIIPSGFSVATTAFALAHSMESYPIILMGQDLSFKKDGHTHAQGTTWQERVVDVTSHSLVKVPGNVEEEVFTHHVFFSTLRWFETYIEQNSVYCVNATEGGAKIKGTKVMSLREALKTYCAETLSLDYLRESFKQPLPSPEIFDKILADLQNAIKDVTVSQKMAVDGATTTKRLLDSLMDGIDENSRKFMRNARKVQTLVDKLRAKEGMFFLDPWMQEVYVFLHKTQDGIKELKEYSVTVQEVNRAGVFFEGLHKASTEVLPLLEEAKKKTKKLYNETYVKEIEKKLCIVSFEMTDDAPSLRDIHDDMLEALCDSGHHIIKLKSVNNSSFDEGAVNEILKHKPDVVFTLENYGLNPRLIDEVNIPVLNVCAYNPFLKNNSSWLKHNHYLFVSEPGDVSRLHDEDFLNVFYLPPSGHPGRFYKKTDEEVYEKHRCDVSFSAMSFVDSFVDSFSEGQQANEQITSMISDVLNMQKTHLSMDLQEVIRSLRFGDHFEYKERTALENRLLFITQQATTLHRLKFLKKIPGHFNFKLFGDEGWKGFMPDASHGGLAGYGKELVDVYNAAKINLVLNTYRLTGFHSKVVDVALCKAFALCEYTPGLEEYFTYGEDSVWFKTPEEMVELIDYYLAHPDERQRIAENAYKNVLENHTVAHRMKSMLDIVIQEL